MEKNISKKKQCAAGSEEIPLPLRKIHPSTEPAQWKMKHTCFLFFHCTLKYSIFMGTFPAEAEEGFLLTRKLLLCAKHRLIDESFSSPAAIQQEKKIPIIIHNQACIAN